MRNPYRNVFGKVVALATAVVLSLGAFTSCSSDDASTDPNKTTGADPNAKGGENNPVKIGVVGASDKYWDTFKGELKDEGIYVDIVDFAEYPLPNPALSAGDLDLNQFQHIIYLAAYVANTGNALSPIGSTAIYPLTLHSQKYKSVAEIPAGSEIAIPNDPSNLSRALLVLQSAGLLKLQGGGTIFSTDLDVIEAESKVKVRPVAADLLPSTLADLAGAVMNNDWVVKAGLNMEDAIAQDDPSDPAAQPYINIWVSRPEDVNNALYLRIVELFHSSTQVISELKEISGGSAVVVNVAAAELQASLDKTVADTKANS
ncbi:MAG: methionine ABC transporter substrate-binding protein [Propionibacteriaceae bacterium]|jgi:D-methionine transport system substrate-binding protein|nr:methionine ABC transporter substrate-binding protein [Propionibacteriaceae bacterium]